jgi:hypothetical protein
MINYHRFFPPRLNRMLSQSLIVGAFATVGILSGITPDISARSGVVFSSAAYAQAISNTEVTNYARSVLVMEPVRQTAFTEIQENDSWGYSSDCLSQVRKLKCSSRQRPQDCGKLL